MSFLGDIFGTEKGVDNILDKDKGLLVKAGGWIGNMNFTAEERAEYNHKLMKLSVEKLKALAPFKVMQRIMVSIIMTEWFLIANSILLAIWLRLPDVKKDLMEFAMSEFAWMPVLAAVTLYLMGGVVPSREK